MGLRGWRTYYPDGLAVSSAEAAPTKLPDGVCRVVEFLDPPYRQMVPAGDWYVFDGERWSSTGTGEWGTWKPRPEAGVVVRSCARQPPEQINAVEKQAMEDRKWP